MKWAEELGLLMKEYSLSVEEVTRICGVSKPTVKRWLDGRSEPHPILIPNMIKALKVKYL